MSADWHILTGEYPPQPGGVSDYSRLLAIALAKAGDRVTVWAPSVEARELEAEGVDIHRLEDPFSPAGLRRLSEALSGVPSQSILLVQYVPTSFGYRAMNVAFAAWLAARAQRLWLMIHEAAYPLGLRVPIALSVRGLVNRGMAVAALARAEQVFVSIPAWADTLRPLTRPRDFTELPIPSTLPTEVSPADAAEARARAGGGAPVLLGHFGTYGALIARMLAALLPPLLAERPDRRALLIGRGAGRFADRLALESPATARRVGSAEALEPAAAAAHIAACDVMLQPFPDGATGRRTSLMAALALGKPVVTNAGHLSDPFWRTTDAVARAASPEPADLWATAEQLVAQPERWPPLGERAATLYRERFSLERTVRTLRESAA